MNPDLSISMISSVKMITLGCRVRDVVTGITGVVSKRCESIGGHAEYLVERFDGGCLICYWINEARLELEDHLK